MAARNSHALSKSFREDVAERHHLDALFSVVYEELRRLAAVVKRNDPSHTLNPTALVHKAWLKLAHSPEVAEASPAHFRHIASRAIRQILVEAARRRHAEKRGGGLTLLEYNDELSPVASFGHDVIALDAALQEFALSFERPAAVVEYRFFGGCTNAEIAEYLHISEETVVRDWRFAKAWLQKALRQ